MPLELGQSVRLARQENVHCEGIAVIRQFEDLKGSGIEIIERGLLLHHVHLNGAPALNREWGIVCQLGLERSGPRALEVDGVGENEPRVGMEGRRREQILDFVLGAAGNPGVDPGANGLGLVDEIHGIKFGSVGGAHRVEVGGEEGVVLLRPEAIGDVEPVAVRFGAGL